MASRNRVGIVDLMAVSARGLAGRQFSTWISAADPDTETQVVDSDWTEIESFDALVVTGAEPSTADLRQDPCHAVVGRILESTSAPVVFSCLSAHSALNHLYALPRRRLPAKRIGVFEHAVAPGPLTAGLSDVVHVPHSRWNTVDLMGVTAQMVTVDGDWAYAAADRYMFVQGHPEYFPDTLFREYRRDVRRYLSRESDDFPTIPSGYFTVETLAELADFSVRARRRRSPDTFAAFPDVRRATGDGWAGPAVKVAANWLAAVRGAVNV
ncbi:homoserine O-succinyltransferase [Kibdelosporangium persicum]|uniref:Homoserine O-succinyltransferase n=1 Tax=Kibdelosporangium persicum TaxID=2698649 RepID=A0ABX2FJB9_9PSEU|nr:homoserine O-succinyltransferase [Kibdelosporangium persicum]NRN70982.1 Homoserine O-succinyltransferase [Kibdelosporangium persicum]